MRLSWTCFADEFRNLVFCHCSLIFRAVDDCGHHVQPKNGIPRPLSFPGEIDFQDPQLLMILVAAAGLPTARACRAARKALGKEKQIRDVS